MARLSMVAFLAVTLSALVASAAAPYQLTSKVETTTDKLTMNDGNIGRMKMEVDGTKHKLEISFIKAKDAAEALVVFLVWDDKTIIQAETRRIELAK